MPAPVKWLLVSLLALACSSQPSGGMSVQLQTMSNVDTTGIQGITLYLYGVDCANGPKCQQVMDGAMPPRGGMLGNGLAQPTQPGQYVHIDPSSLMSSCVLLYVEAYKTNAFPGKVIAAGCADVTLPSKGSTPVVVDMVSTTDADEDGWIGEFNFPDNTHKLGPDCNDSDATIYPEANEVPCTGDRNCDGKSTCNRQCQSNADCVGNPNGACCSFAPSYLCQQCPMSSCATSSECTTGSNATHCCERQGTQSACVTPTTSTLCQCITSTECMALGPAQCCVSNQNTATDLTPGTCTDVNRYLQTHQGIRTEWCRCETSAQCDNLFPQLAGQICCVQNRMVCDAPNTQIGEHCAP